MKKKILILFLIFLLAGLVAWKPILAAGKVVGLITQEFPQIPFKPLNYVTSEPKVESVKFGSGEEKILGKLALPPGEKKHPAIIVVMGVKTDEKGEKLLLSISKTLARLGYIALWPISEEVDAREQKLEKPAVFVESFKYLETHPKVDKERVSFFGISVGSGVALVAAQHPEIADKVHTFVSFGGYYRLSDYLAAVATKKIVIDGQTASWQPAEGTVRGVKEAVVEFGDKTEGEILQKVLLEGKVLSKPERQNLSKKAELYLKIFESESPKEVEELLKLADPESLQEIKNLSPDEQIDRFKARIFILHDRADPAVPYIESRKLKAALEGKVKVTYHEAVLFEHVRPKEGFSLQTLKELLGLFRFVHQVFMFI